MHEAVTWRSVLPDIICWHAWDDEIVVFSNLTGNTHLLTSLVATAFRRLVESDISYTSAELVKAIGQIKAIEPDAALIQAVEAAMAALERFGLVTRGSA